MVTFAEQLARLRVAAATGVLPADVGRWALEAIGEQGAEAERIERRNLILREAASRVSGSRWAKARRLEQEIQAVRAGSRMRGQDGVRPLVRRALAAGPAPESLRHLLRVLAD